MTQIKRAEQAYPGAKIQTGKAWTEMVHRYFAGSLGLLILVLAIWAIKRRYVKMANQPLVIPLLLVLLVAFQAVLGMWTVTWQLLPLVVMGHLLGGMAIVALLWWVTLRSGQCLQTHHMTRPGMQPWAVLGLLIVCGQIMLGGWTSANYAALVCPNFPFCHGLLFPHMNFHTAFNFFSPIGNNYDGGHLGTTARVTIQMMHRYGAMITSFYIGLLSLCLIFSAQNTRLRPLGWTLLIVLGVQFSLGVLNVEWLLPLPIAVAHNGVAALLLLTMVTLVYKLSLQPRGDKANG